MRTEGVVRVGDREVHLLGTVRGLASEAGRVEAAFARLAPASLALGVAPEDLDGLEQLRGGASYEHDYSDADALYAHFLGQFGPVQLPPRDLVVALDLARAQGIPVVAVDLPEVAYVDAFTKAVGGLELLWYNRRIRKLARKPPPAAPDAMAFHLWWDRHVTGLKGMASVERLRERAMARGLVEGAFPPGIVLAVLEAARVEGVLAALEQPALANPRS